MHSFPLCLLALCVVVATPAEAAERIEYKLSGRAGLSNVEIKTQSTSATRPERRAVTDLLLDVWSGGSDVATLLQLENARAATTSRALFKARLLLVSAGRLMTHAAASCGPWVRELSICASDCDGGSSRSAVPRAMVLPGSTC